jgi:hypothetical protein
VAEGAVARTLARGIAHRRDPRPGRGRRWVAGGLPTATSSFLCTRFTTPTPRPRRTLGLAATSSFLCTRFTLPASV